MQKVQHVFGYVRVQVIGSGRKCCRTLRPATGYGLRAKEKDQAKVNFARSFSFVRDSGGIQTHNLLIRSQMLYSVELRNLRSLIAGAKVHTFSETTKLFRHFF